MKEYRCVRCGNCCRWRGWVRLTDTDIRRISGFLAMSEREFIERHTRLRPARDGLALKERENGECIFLVGRNVCTIQKVKPVQCEGFPNRWRFDGWRGMCEAEEIGADGV